jgi:sugar lactone lactonase YvrE
MRRVVLVALLAGLAVPAALAGAASFPNVISLPNGWLPEGIAVGNGHTFYAGSRANGAVYRGDLQSGKGSVLVQGVAGRVATGLKYDRGKLFVSGASTGKAWVYDARTGAQLREYQLATGPGGTFVNDVVVTKDGAFFTDSSRDVLYRVALGRNGSLGDLQTLKLTGDFQFVTGFNLNGIDATANGQTLIAVQTNTGKLYRIDPKTGVASLIDLGGATLVNGDGILLHGRTLYVVQNQDNKIAVVHLSPNVAKGTVARTITNPNLDVPTTIARFGAWLYAVNARFTTPPTPATPYTVVQVRR